MMEVPCPPFGVFGIKEAIETSVIIFILKDNTRIYRKQ